MQLLGSKTRALMEKGVKSGVPAVTVGGSLAIPRRTVELWMACGMRCLEQGIVKPEDPKKLQEFTGERMIACGDWYMHELNCRALARVVLTTEAGLVGGLVKRMWATSKRNPEMQKFLFNRYTHAHGMVEPKQGVRIETEVDELLGAGTPTSGGITLYLPHNGREEPTKPIGKPSASAPKKVRK
jgi:hypothetical protein